MRSRRGVISALVSALIASALVGVAAIAPASAETTTVADTWEDAQQLTGSAGSLWKPTFTAGLPITGGVTVMDGKPSPSTRSMGVQANYIQGTRTITIQENYKGTSAAFDPEPNIASMPVGTTRIRVGSPDMRYTVKASINANCYIKEPGPDGSVPAPPAGFRCSRADVAKYGGSLSVTMRPASTMTAPGTTFVNITVSKGVTYKQLIRIVQGLVQIGP